MATELLCVVEARPCHREIGLVEGHHATGQQGASAGAWAAGRALENRVGPASTIDEVLVGEVLPQGANELQPVVLMLRGLKREPDSTAQVGGLSVELVKLHCLARAEHVPRGRVRDRAAPREMRKATRRLGAGISKEFERVF